MAPALLFLALLNYCSGVHSQPAVIQPDSQSVSLGQTTKLPCSKSSGSLDSFYWYQQKPRDAPRFVLYGADKRGEGIPDRFTGSSSGNTGYLTISNIQAEDEAVYFCLTCVSLWWIFGGGTHLTVTGQPTVPPTVNVFPPSPEELKSSDKATAVCLMDGFYPGTVQVTWQADGATISSGVETTTPTKLNDKYAASSYLSMKKSDWESYETVICKVTHDGKTVEKVVRRLDCA
ncbi:immunoglobulin lambda-1 light chain-like [Podarcis raffonei]|uniref:immunoglobulin lambda-1 light chain-like n=1 Tax=Podarcis raffonei TaxID=65483 RepID=UPI00232910DF|nr:immunoglobulin lambda-1 light chain-like [Podarcis raffonei]